MVELERSRELLRNFGLATAAELLDAHLEKATHGEVTYAAFWCGLLETEEQAKKCRGEETSETNLKLSRLPHHKTLDEFDFSFQPSIDTRLMKELSTLAFAARKENVIFLGPPGVGKTHLAAGLAMKAI